LDGLMTFFRQAGAAVRAAHGHIRRTKP